MTELTQTTETPVREGFCHFCQFCHYELELHS
jgi:hypothetical protein